VVPETQQRISTSVEKRDGELKVDIIACRALDDELQSEFHNKINKLSTDAVNLRSQPTYSNQGNELYQSVTLRFSVDDKIEGVNVADEVVRLGKEFYERQLERNLAREDGDHINQQKYFEDDDIEEFCLLYRGKMEF
jgi:hypothetical protein